MGLSSLAPYALIAAAVLVSATGLLVFFRGLRIGGRKRRGECVACGHMLGVPGAPQPASPQPTSPQPASPPTPPADAVPTAPPPVPSAVLSTVCTECGRDPALDRDALRLATALIALGLAAQFVWILFGAIRWTPAAVLLVETSVALLVFAIEPGLERVRRLLGGRPRLRPVPKRLLFRLAALAAVVGFWSWIGWRVDQGQRFRAFTGTRPMNSPLLRVLVTNRTQWMERVLPPTLAYDARVGGIVAETTPLTAAPMLPEVRAIVRSLWIRGSMAHALTIVDVGNFSELRLLQLEDEPFLADDLPVLPTLDAVEVLDLDGSALTPAAIEPLVRKAPKLRILRVNSLNAEQSAAIRATFPTLEVDAAELFPRPRGQRRSVSG